MGCAGGAGQAPVEPETPIPGQGTSATALAPTPVPSPLASPPLSPPPPAALEGDADLARVQGAVVGGQFFRLEVARTPEERARGLMGRPSLPEDTAMLFVFDRKDYLVFWMKDTLIPLDILFLDAGRIVVDVQTMEPQPGVPDALLRRHRSARPALYALEMNAGLAGRYGIETGAEVEFR